MNLTSYLANKCFAYLLNCDTNQGNKIFRPNIRQKSTSDSNFRFTFQLPWSVGPELFQNLCDRCGSCASACKNNIIAPDKQGYPQVDFSRGGCSFCGACAQICPKQALQFDPAVPPWHLNAIITTDCLLNNKVICNACTEHCDKGAISFRGTLIQQNKTLRVQPEKCNGCGACYRSCPVNAIAFKSLKPSQP